MTRRLATAVAAAVLAAALAGCTITPDRVPAGPTDDEIVAFHDTMLDKTWAASGIAGVVDRPTVRVGPILAPNDWSETVSECMNTVVAGAYGWSYSPQEGYVLMVAEPGAEAFSNDEILGWYVCIAQHPVNAASIGMLHSPAESAYLYSYFQRWLIPCFESHGIAVSGEPSRAQFFAGGTYSRWNPYYTLLSEPRGGFELLQRECGSLEGAIPTTVLGG